MKASSYSIAMMWQILILAAVLFKAATSQITGTGNTTAEYGGNAYYKCTLANQEGVLQVTWQRLFRDDSIENLATYSKRFGQQVNEPYQGKVIFTEAKLSSTSITLTNVTWDDESCYICSFNVYPDGSKRKQTCLMVQGISEVHTSVHASSREHKAEEAQEVVFSCSATGKPVPTIEWDYAHSASPSYQPMASTVAHSDHTFTSSRNITLQVSPDWNGHVDCLLNSGMTGQRRERIYFSSGRHGKKEKGNRLSYQLLLLLISSVVTAVIIIAIAITMMLKRRNAKMIHCANSTCEESTL